MKPLFCESFGPSDLSKYEIESLCKSADSQCVTITHLFYWYSCSGYEGSGIAIYQDDSNRWHKEELGHCSCFGPFDNGYNAIPYTKEQVITLLKEYAKGYIGEEMGKKKTAMIASINCADRGSEVVRNKIIKSTENKLENNEKRICSVVKQEVEGILGRGSVDQVWIDTDEVYDDFLHIHVELQSMSDAPSKAIEP